MTLNEIITKLREDASQMESPFYTKTPADPGWDYTAKAFREIADELEATTRGVSEKMDYLEATKDLVLTNCAGLPLMRVEPLINAILALLDKVRQEARNEMLRWVVASLVSYPKGGGDIEVMKEVDRIRDKVRQEQAAECAKHKPSFNSESCMADGCDWKFGNGKITWSEHISALGRK